MTDGSHAERRVGYSGLSGPEELRYAFIHGRTNSSSGDRGEGKRRQQLPASDSRHGAHYDIGLPKTLRGRYTLLRMAMRSICVWLLIAAATPALLHAEEQPSAPATLDVGDLWRDLRNRGDKPEEPPLA